MRLILVNFGRDNKLTYDLKNWFMSSKFKNALKLCLTMRYIATFIVREVWVRQWLPCKEHLPICLLAHKNQGAFAHRFVLHCSVPYYTLLMICIQPNCTLLLCNFTAMHCSVLFYTAPQHSAIHWAALSNNYIFVQVLYFTPNTFKLWNIFADNDWFAIVSFYKWKLKWST